MEKSKFDMQKFRDYVNSYDEKKHGLDNDVTIVKDMVYGIGISLDDNEYSFITGLKKFINYLIKLIL